MGEKTLAEVAGRGMQRNSKRRLPGRWKSGESGNPSGKAKGTVCLTARLKARLREHPEEVDALVNTLIQKAIEGSFPHMKEILERVDGKVAETVQVEAPPKRIVLTFGGRRPIDFDGPPELPAGIPEE